MVRTAPFVVSLPYLFTHCINEGPLHDRLLLLYYVNTVIRTIFSLLQNADMRGGGVSE